MYIEMELLARERYETQLREAEEMHRHRSLAGVPHGRSRAPRTLPLPRLRGR
jgi:hypothetical protein